MTELREKLNNIVEEKNTKVTPENLRVGAEAFGVQGTFTADADATAEDIASGKTAYVNGEKITGVAEINNYLNARIDTDFVNAKNRTLKDAERYVRELNIDAIDFSIWTTLTQCFAQYTSLIKMTGTIDCKTITQLNFLFDGCQLMEEGPKIINTEKVIYMNGMYQNCRVLKQIGEIDCSSCVSTNSMLNFCYELEDVGGFINMGKAFTSTTANNSSYTVDLSTCTKLTHDSLMNVINGLYDLNLTYDVANGGTLIPQALILGETNLAKLTADEIAIGTAKRLDCKSVKGGI